jgi:hypothetical protein
MNLFGLMSLFNQNGKLNFIARPINYLSIHTGLSLSCHDLQDGWRLLSNSRLAFSEARLNTGALVLKSDDFK